MAGIYTSNTFTQIAVDLAAALAWLKSVGVQPEPTRIGDYHRAVNLLVSAHREMDLELMRVQFPRINNMLFEVHEIIEIHKALAGRFNDEIAKHAKAFASGPAAYIDEDVENSSNRARNFGFELSVMSILVRSGVAIDFSIDADVVAQFERRTLMIECKRPQSEAAVPRRLTDAIKQLERKYQNPARTRCRGIVALDITKAVNPEFNIFVTRESGDIDRIMSIVVDQFISRNESIWSDFQSSKTIGILLRLRQMNSIETEGSAKLFYGQQHALVQVPTATPLDTDVARSLVRTLLVGLQNAV